MHFSCFLFTQYLSISNSMCVCVCRSFSPSFLFLFFFIFVDFLHFHFHRIWDDFISQPMAMHFIAFWIDSNSQSTQKENTHTKRFYRQKIFSSCSTSLRINSILSFLIENFHRLLWRRAQERVSVCV